MVQVSLKSWWVVVCGICCGCSLCMIGCDKKANNNPQTAGNTKVVDNTRAGDKEYDLKRYNGKFEVCQWMVSLKAEGIDDSWSLERGLLCFENKQDKNKVKFEFNANDTIEASWASDMDKDGCPEISVRQGCAGSGSYGTVTTFELVNGKIKSYGLPSMNCSGYGGHDSFNLQKQKAKLIRKFPLYSMKDSNAEPTNGEHVIVYRFGDKGWEKIKEYDSLFKKEVQKMKKALNM